MYEYNAKIIKVVDGDTVDVDIDLGFNMILSKQRIRLKGVDTPETRTRDLEEKKYGLLAKEFVKSFLKKGETYKLTTSKDGKGKYGRILGDFVVYNPKTDTWTRLCSLLVLNSHAVPYMGQSKEEIREQHLENRKRVDEQTNLE